MISTTAFSLMSPDWLGVNTFALLHILDFISEQIKAAEGEEGLNKAADGEEGLNNVPLFQK